MPLFGHKNKNHHDNTDMNHTGVNDTAYNTGQRDYATDRGLAGHGRSRDDNLSNNANFQDPNNFGSSTNQASALGGPAGGAGLGSGAGVDTGMQSHRTHATDHGHHGAGAGMVGSAALREQAMMRDREAQNFQAQSKELAEAERLEQQAREHRDRAVAQGAHPMNKHLGGGNVGTGGQHVTFDQGRNGNM